MRVAVVFAACLAAWAGWREFLFLTDDAFIAFRYASNSLRGFGLVWNPPPFAPVEGYTSFLWVVLLWGHGRFWLADQRLPEAELDLDDWPGVVALVPARNEAAHLPVTLRALLDLATCREE